MALTDSLVSVWCEAADPTTDEYGTNTLTNNNGVTTATGKVGTAGSFLRSSSQFLSHVDNSDLSLNGTAWTITCWFKKVTDGIRHTLGGKFSGSTGSYLLSVNLDTLLLEVCSSAGFGGYTTAQTGNDYTAGNWYFAAAWLDTTAQKIRVQINRGTVYETAFTTTVFDDSLDFQVGAYVGPTSAMDGLINQFAIWKRVLTDSELDSIYNSGSGLPFASWNPAANNQAWLLKG